jgi:predicted SnoaL-like aldol condensation-catalyzing enzyme/ketosteroid isomerase-like protein
MSKTTPKQNKALVLEAFDTLFNKRDYEAAKRYWSDCYIQHSAHIAPGRDGLFDLVRTLPDTSKYENHIILAEGDFVITHGRFSGNGRQAAWVAADIVRMEDGKLAEHWDVLQDEATKEESKSGLPMFGTSFPKPDPRSGPAGTDSSLGVEEARRIISPLYDALNQPSKKDVAALLAKATNPDYRSYHTNEDWLTRDQLIEVFKNIGSAVPDLHWTIKDIQTLGNQIVVRGEATGTPTGEFWGAKPTGKSFKTMAIDVFTVKNGKLASAYHVENWMTALQQIGK